MQNSTQFSNTNASGIKCDPGIKQTDALNSFRENLSNHAEQTQCVAGRAEPTAEFGKGFNVKKFKKSATGFKSIYSQQTDTQSFGRLVFIL